MRTQNGFTLLEMMLSVAMMMLLLGISLPIYRSYHVNTDLASAKSVVSTVLLQAKTQALAGELDDDWGVVVEPGTVTLFKGDSFASRDAAFDISTRISSSLAIAGISEIYFEKVTGVPSASGQIELINQINRQAVITISDVGIISD